MMSCTILLNTQLEFIVISFGDTDRFSIFRLIVTYNCKENVAELCSMYTGFLHAICMHVQCVTYWISNIYIKSRLLHKQCFNNFEEMPVCGGGSI